APRLSPPPPRRGQRQRRTLGDAVAPAADRARRDAHACGHLVHHGACMEASARLGLDALVERQGGKEQPPPGFDHLEARDAEAAMLLRALAVMRGLMLWMTELVATHLAGRYYSEFAGI